MTPAPLLEAARSLADELERDVHQARDRESHVRSVARAHAARLLLAGLEAAQRGTETLEPGHAPVSAHPAA